MDATNSQSGTGDVTGPTSPAEKNPFFPNPDFIPIALRDGRVGVWSWDITTGNLTWSSNLEDVLGRSRGTINAASSVFETDVHPEDRAAVAAAMRETAQTLKPRRITYRLLPSP